MKQNFFTGLAILLPIALTFWILSFLVQLLTNPFLVFTENILKYYDLLDHPFLFFTGDQMLLFWSRLLIIAFLGGIAILAGFLARILFLNFFFRLGDYIIRRIPFVNRIYKATQDVVSTLFGAQKPAFAKVVLVPFPHENAYSLGMITSEGLHDESDPEHMDKVSIFIPGTPNPTFGFMLLYKREQLVLLDMSIDEALKFIVSMGVMAPDFKISLNQNLPKENKEGHQI